MKNQERRIPILFGNFTHLEFSRGQEAKSVDYPEWLDWITTLKKLSKINLSSAKSITWGLKFCLFLFSFEQRNSKLPFWTFPSHLAFKMLWKSKFPTISKFFKITQHSCHSSTLKELWRSGNCIGLEVENVPLSHPQLIWPWTSHFYSEHKRFFSP